MNARLEPMWHVDWQRAARFGFVLVAGLTLASRTSAVTGAPGTSPASPSVVAIGTLPVACGMAFAGHCSGVLVAPSLVLTAAHCVEGARTTGRLQVWAGAGEQAEVVGVSGVTHPSHVEDGSSLDLALLTLARAVTAPPIRLENRTFEQDLVGSAAQVQGFGVSLVGGRTSGAVATGNVTITTLDERLIGFGPAPNMICDGDSGGALFVAGESGLELSGILIQADPACRSWGKAVRLDAGSRDFVDTNVAASLALPVASARRTSSGPAAYAELCSSSCELDDDCPLGTNCLSVSGSPRRCVPAGLMPGQISGSCAASASCDACVQIEGGLPECACYRFCSDESKGSEPAGCTLAPAQLSIAGLPFARGLLLIAILVLGVKARRRSRRLGRSGA